NTGLPLGRWIQALDSPKLPEHLRERLVQAGWVRAVLLGNEVAAKSLAPKLRAMSPELKDLLTDDSRFTAIYALLNAPGLQPYLQAGLGRLNWENKTIPPTTLDEFRRNWWCAAGPSRLDADGNAKAIAPPDLTFLGAAEKISATREAEVIRSGGAGPNFLGRLATDYITKNPEDPRGARTLHLVVRATRYSCTDANTATVSKRAFQLLHKLYPRSDWAKKTPSWFGG
ncbi:MAG TPA: hypothetical protein VEQ63_06000, partial [Bryobacteraceae bacterium]|nr:hypothetical protein [Bryobacteraceae bacterium]